MPEPQRPGDRTVAQRQADHASLERLSESLVPALVQKLNASGLGELEVREGDWRIRLRRPVGAAPRRPERPRYAAHPAPHTPVAPPAEAVVPAETVVPEAPDARRIAVRSPAVGVFKPGAAVGTRVRAGDRVAFVDLLGIAQDVVAPVDGTVVEIYPQAGDGVEYGEEIVLVEADPEPGVASGATGEG